MDPLAIPKALVPQGLRPCCDLAATKMTTEVEVSLTLSLPDATVVEFTRLQSKFTGTVDSGLLLTVIWDVTLCSLSQNVQGA